MSKIKTAILGATGAVGQRFIQLLENHPDFEITALCASDRSAGKKYASLGRWALDTPMPEQVAEETIVPCTPEAAKQSGAELAFSALPADIAGIERELAKDIAVCSNTALHRMEPDVPLMIPEVNPEHLQLIDQQKQNRDWNGFIVTNPNCSTIGLAIPLKPLFDNFQINSVTVSTMQALSGAGYPGVPSLAINDNVIPYIQGEEEKMEIETMKLLGKYQDRKIQNAVFPLSAACNRVNVSDGHTESVFVSIKEEPDLQDIGKIFSEFKAEPQDLALHTAPERPIILFNDKDRPQPRKDRLLGNGMAVSIGNIRKDFQGIKFTVLSHNTIRGAAGASILNAELLRAKGYL